MDYTRIYNNLIETRKNRNTKQYTEEHHIIPRCMGGNDDKENLVRLTYKEHYMAHYLLSKIYPNNPKIQYGFLCMLRNPHGHRILTSGMYDTIKRNYSDFKKWYAKINNPGRTDKSRIRAKNRMLSDDNPMKKFPEKNPFKGKSFVKGKKWYNNGVENLYLNEHDTIPDGFVSGMVYKPRKKK